MYHFYCVIIFACFTSFFVGTALAKEHIQVVTENWYPYNYLDENNNIVGQSTERVKHVLKAADLDYSIASYPWTRAFNLATTSPNVLIYTVLRTPDREDLFHWICPIVNKEVYQLYRLTSRTDIQLKTEQDIKNYSTVVTRDTFLHKLMLELGLSEEQNLQVTADDNINATLFLAGRVDILPAIDTAIEHILATQGIDKSVISPLLTISAQHYPDYCMALSKATPQPLVQQIRQAHQSINLH